MSHGQETTNFQPSLWPSEMCVVTYATCSKVQTINYVLNSGKMILRQLNWWNKCMSIYVYFGHRYSGGVQDLKQAWKRQKMKLYQEVKFLIVMKSSLPKSKNWYMIIVVGLWRQMEMNLLLAERRLVWWPKTCTCWILNRHHLNLWHNVFNRL